MLLWRVCRPIWCLWLLVNHKVLCLVRCFFLSLLTPESVAFSYLINDLIESITSSVRLFADDCLVYRTIHSSNDSIPLQEDLVQLGLFVNSWQMTLIPHKCSIMHNSYKHNTVCSKYYINGFPLDCFSDVKYLGVSISSKMSWSDHIDDICTRARKSLGFIRWNLRNCPQCVRNQAYTSLVRPILEYACCVWDPHQRKYIKHLESVQRHAARFTTWNYYKMNPGCVSNMVNQLGWDLLEHRIANHRITMFYKTINNLANIPVHHQLKVHNGSIRGSASHNFRQLNTKLNCYKYSFLPAAIVS